MSDTLKTFICTPNTVLRITTVSGHQPYDFTPAWSHRNIHAVRLELKRLANFELMV
ncbi:MAG: hypothetical protein HC850_11970 [Rhodomicrobium sp.]|nr:hypothetical protein [Rhodomicrobium sp.]